MENKENNFISAVLYIHNNANSIKTFISKINAVFRENFKKYEIVCVNDCSDDNSVEIIRECGGNLEGGAIILVNTGFYQGLESAMLAGVDYAAGDFVFEFDTLDSDYEATTIMDVYHHCINGCDIVGASSSTKLRKSSQMFYALFNRFSHVQYKIKTESFRILSRRAINRINQMSLTIPYRKAIYANCGLKYENITYKSIPGTQAIHKLNSAYRQGIAFDSLIIFTNLAYKISLILTFLMICFSVFSGVYTLIVYLNGNPVAGWTTTMLMLSFGFFGIFGILSIIIKYLSVIINLIFKKTKYVIGSIERL